MTFLSSASYAASVISAGSSTSSPTYLTGFTPKPWYHFTLRTTILLILPFLSLFGTYGTWVLGNNNGTIQSISALISQNDPKFPGTLEPLQTNYTGVSRMDKQLTLLVTFFAPVVDGNRDALQLFSLFGLGQFGGIWTLMVLESLRMGNVGRGVSWIATTGVILQNISFTVTVPIWLLLHLFTSPVAKPFPGTHANSVLLVPALDLRILPFSIFISYIIPSILMGLPSPEIVPLAIHQNLIAFWQAFPIWTVIVHGILRRTTQLVVGGLTKESTTPVPLGASYLSNVKYVYRSVLGFCILTHVPVFLAAVIPGALVKNASISPLLQHTFAEVFIPYFPSTSHNVSSLGEGVLTFLQWDIYIGTTACLLWAILLYRNATTEKMIVDPISTLPKYKELLLGVKTQDGMLWRKLVLKVGIWGLVGGPVGAVTVLLWERDAIVRQKIKQGI